MISPDRLDELATLVVEEDVPDENSAGHPVKIGLLPSEVRDLVSLIPIVRAAIELRDAVLSHWVTKPDVLRASKRMGEEMGLSIGEAPRE